MIGVVVLWMFLSGAKSPQILRQPGAGANVPANFTEVYGSVSLTGAGLSATSIEFKQYGTNSIYFASVDNGSYSIVLPDASTYSSVVYWIGPYKWQNGFTDSEHVLEVLRNDSQTQQNNVVLQLANDTVYIYGNVHLLQPNYTPTGLQLRAPKNLTIRDTLGGVYLANVSGSGAYEIALPNWMAYNVVVGWQGNYGTFGSCAANSITEYGYAWISKDREDFVC